MHSMLLGIEPYTMTFCRAQFEVYTKSTCLAYFHLLIYKVPYAGSHQRVPEIPYRYYDMTQKFLSQNTHVNSKVLHA